MSDINQIITEITMDQLKDHFAEHGKKYLIGLAALGLGAAGKHGYTKYQHYKRNKGITGHLKRHREGYGGAALGATTAALSSGNQPLSHRLLKTLAGGVAGGASGMMLGNIRHAEEFQNKLKAK